MWLCLCLPCSLSVSLCNTAWKCRYCKYHWHCHFVKLKAGSTYSQSKCKFTQICSSIGIFFFIVFSFFHAHVNLHSLSTRVSFVLFCILEYVAEYSFIFDICEVRFFVWTMYEFLVITWGRMKYGKAALKHLKLYIYICHAMRMNFLMQSFSPKMGCLQLQIA